MSDDYTNQLEELRRQIDDADLILLKTLHRRFEVVEQIGALKRAQELPIVQKERSAAILRERTDLGRKMGLAPEFVKKIFELIHEESVACQEQDKADQGSRRGVR